MKVNLSVMTCGQRSRYDVTEGHIFLRYRPPFVPVYSRVVSIPVKGLLVHHTTVSARAGVPQALVQSLIIKSVQMKRRLSIKRLASR